MDTYETAEPVLQHTIRSWAGNTFPVYAEVQRIVSGARHHCAAEQVRAEVRDRVRDLIADLLYGAAGMPRLRNLYRKVYGIRTRNLPDGALMDKFRSGFTRSEFDSLDWTTLVHDLTEGMYEG